MKASKFDFLTSSRFWAMIVGAVSIYLKMKGLIGDAEMQLIATISGGFVVVKTVDRVTDKNAESRNTTPDQFSEGI